MKTMLFHDVFSIGELGANWNPFFNLCFCGNFVFGKWWWLA